MKIDFYYLNNYILIIYMNSIDIYIINLEKRQDKLEYLKNYFTNNVFNINFKVFKAIENEIGWQGCLDSHLTLIKYAYDNNLPYIIIMEDDFSLKINFNLFENLLSDLIKLEDVDIFNGCPSYVQSLKKYKYINDNFYLVTGVLSTAFIIYYKNSFIKLLSFDLKKPIDVINYNLFKQLIYKNQFGEQKDFYSDVSNSFSSHSLHYSFIYDVIDIIPFSEIL